MLLLLMLAMVGITVAGGAWLAVSRARTVKGLRTRMEEDARARLMLIADEEGDKLVDGPALETAEGRIELGSAEGPQGTVIDTAAFTCEIGTSFRLDVMPAKDAVRMIRSKGFFPVTPADAAVAASYSVYASDEAFAHSTVTPELAEKLQSLDRAVRARSRLRVWPGGMSVAIRRGLAGPEELRAFRDGCVAIVRFVRSRLKS